jgi:GDP-L-fucose synthase
MKEGSSIFIAGHRGLVGSAIFRRFHAQGYGNLITRTHAELDLGRQADVEAFFELERPEYVLLAAARVGGIWANNTYPAEFIYENLAVQTHVLHAAWRWGANRLLFLGSSCVYPRDCPQPMREDHLLSGPLEGTNQPYAVAKIAGIVQCEAYNRQYGTRFLAVMPTNLYGPNDNFHLDTSHVLPALIRKFHLAKLASHGDWEAMARDEARFGPISADFLACLVSISRHGGHQVPDSMAARFASSLTSDLRPVTSGVSPNSELRTPNSNVVLWGTGTPRRELLHVDDLADACLFLMNLPEDRFHSLLCPDVAPCAMRHTPCPSLPLINIGCGEDLTIRELAALVARVVGYRGETRWDNTKPDGTPRKRLDVSRLRDLGWSPRIPLETGIRTTYEWYLSQTRLL